MFTKAVPSEKLNANTIFIFGISDVYVINGLLLLLLLFIVKNDTTMLKKSKKCQL